MYKAIFIDLDGTLLDDEKNISVENKTAIKRVQEKGVKVIICSGRQKSLVEDYKKEVGANSYAICCNGAQIYDFDNREELLSLPVAEDLIYGFYEYANKNNYLIRFDTKYGRYINNMDYFISKEIYLDEKIEKFVNENPILQITFGAKTEEEIDKIIENIKSLNRADIKIENKYIAKARTYEIWAINIINVSASKGNAINGLCRFLKIPIEEVIGIGDDLNDISMMKMVGHGVAMGNALDCVKEIADEITDTNTNNGVAQLLNKII